MSSKWDNKNIFIVEAPTGYGKTTLTATLALYTLKNELKTIIVYPLRSLLEDQYKKFSKLLGEEDVLGKRYMHCLLYTSPSPRDLSTSRMPSSA